MKFLKKFLLVTTLFMGCLFTLPALSQAKQQFDDYEEAMDAAEAKCKTSCVILSKEEAVEFIEMINSRMGMVFQQGLFQGFEAGQATCPAEEKEPE